MIPYIAGKRAPNSTNSTRGLAKYVPGRIYFRTVPSQDGDKFVTSPPPPQSLNGSLDCLQEEYPARLLPTPPPSYIDNLQSRLIRARKGIFPASLKMIPKPQCSPMV